MSARVLPARTNPWDTQQTFKAVCLDCEVEWAWGYDWRESEAAALEHNARFHAIKP